MKFRSLALALALTATPVWFATAHEYVHQVQGHEEHGHEEHGHEEHGHEEQGQQEQGQEEHDHATVIEHDEVQIFENNGNQLRGIATLGTGAEEFEVWRSSVAPGSATPKHTHESEEVFVFLKGKGRAVIGDEEIEFEAPCTLVAPAGVPHQYWNVGDEPTDAIVIIGIGSKIWNAEGEEMQLPWRQ